MKQTKLRVHTFVWDPDIPEDADNRTFCFCGLREDHPRHNLPPTEPDVRAAEARRVGDEA